MRIVIFASRFLVPCTYSHGTWINACVFLRLGVSQWLHVLLIKHQVDVVPGDCQNIIILFTRNFNCIPCPSVNFASTGLN